uniref:Uncharacterized protein n=1 Tax=Populus alba TaxID=43335 RepID=A0A4U5MIF3_POPAL|nr:hypothetical protein D5086_0000309020 [Populus alba]
MAEATVIFFLQRLECLLLRETETFAGLEDQKEMVKGTIKEVGCFYGDRGNTEGYAVFSRWETELKNLFDDLDDHVDEFVIQMDQQQGSDSEAEKEENEGNREQSDGDKEGQTSVESSSVPFRLKYNSLPYYLRSCLIYCCIFPENYGIAKGRLIRLLVAEGLIQEKAGQIVEDIAEENINDLVRQGMLLVNDDLRDNGT